MRKLRIFVVELILVGILVAWIYEQFPHLVDKIIPWIVLAIGWHLIWEIVLQTQWAKGKAKIAHAKWRNMSWIIVFCVGGFISVGFWYSANRLISALPAFSKPEQPQRIIQISYSMLESLPIVVSPNSDVYIISFHQNRTASLTHAYNRETREWYWPKKEVVNRDFIGLCRIWNQGEKIVFNISVTFGVHFREQEKDKPILASVNQIVFIDGSIKPGDSTPIFL